MKRDNKKYLKIVLNDISFHADSTFLTVRRAAPLFPILFLWQCQVVKENPKNPAKIHYAREFGIDSGAIAEEYFTDVVDEI